MASGGLVDDKTVIDIVRNLKENPATFLDGKFAEAEGLILDGVPRTLAQAEMLQEFVNIDLVINFQAMDEILIQKLMGRRSCPVCNKSFNVAGIREHGYSLPPLLPTGDDPTVCDEEHSVKEPTKLTMRQDDKEDIIKKRLDLYKVETVPILNFYR